MISRLLKIIGLFCKRALEKRRYSAKETYHLKEPTSRSATPYCVLGRFLPKETKEDSVPQTVSCFERQRQY